MSGRALGGNSTSTTGPVIATTRPSLVGGASAGLEPVPVVPVPVVAGARGGTRTAHVRSIQLACGKTYISGGAWISSPKPILTLGLGAADYFHDLGRDRVLRALFIWRRRVLIRSSALSVAAFMALCWDR